MAEDRWQAALLRIERAAARVETALQARSQAPDLAERHDRLRTQLAEAIGRIDRLIGPA